MKEIPNSFQISLEFHMTIGFYENKIILKIKNGINLTTGLFTRGVNKITGKSLIKLASNPKISEKSQNPEKFKKILEIPKTQFSTC